MSLGEYSQFPRTDLDSMLTMRITEAKKGLSKDLDANHPINVLFFSTETWGWMTIDGVFALCVTPEQAL